MARPLRIEYAGALYHITSRGNARGDIYGDDDDRQAFLECLAHCCERFKWLCHAYCLMGNHYHLLIETMQATLSRGMQLLNGTYTQHYNRHHEHVGHVFQGRYKSILVQSDAYLHELARYIVLNPVRARMVYRAAEWPWSSYRATAGMAPAHACLTCDVLLSFFSANRRNAYNRYREFVEAGKDQPSPFEQLKNQIYLGDDQFVETVLSHADLDRHLEDIPRVQTLSPAKPLAHFQEHYGNTKRAMAIAYLSGHFSLTEVGKYFEVSRATVSRAVRAHEDGER